MRLVVAQDDSLIESFLNRDNVKYAISEGNLERVFEIWASQGPPNEDLYAYLKERDIEPFEYMNTIWSHVIHYSHHLRTVEEIVIPANVRELGPYAFSRCIELKIIRFTRCINSFPERMLDHLNIGKGCFVTIQWPGTKQSFRKVNKGPNWHSGTEVHVECTDGMLEYKATV